MNQKTAAEEIQIYGIEPHSRYIDPVYLAEDINEDALIEYVKIRHIPMDKALKV